MGEGVNKQKPRSDVIWRRMIGMSFPPLGLPCQIDTVSSLPKKFLGFPSLNPCLSNFEKNSFSTNFDARKPVHFFIRQLRQARTIFITWRIYPGEATQRANFTQPDNAQDPIKVGLEQRGHRFWP